MKRLPLILVYVLLSMMLISCTAPAKMPENITETKVPAEEISAEEKQRVDLYIAVMKAAFNIENGGDDFVAVKLDTLDGLSDAAKQEVLKQLSVLSENVYSFEDIKDDKTKLEFDSHGRKQKTIDGTLLWVNILEYSNTKAKINGTSWFGSLGAVLPRYEATYVNGEWHLKLISMAIA